MQADFTPIAVIGISCWYPGARNPRQLWENILARRRQFRLFPDERLPLSEYYHPDMSEPDKTYGRKAAVIDGFEFDWAGKRIALSTYESADIAHWLALDVALSAISNAGYDRENIPREKTGVVVGNSLTGEQTRTNAMRLRWPFVGRALRAAAQSLNMPHEQLLELENRLETYYKSVFPAFTEDSLAGGLSNTIAGRICNYLNVFGGGYVVDGACSSSLIAVHTAASALANGSMDLVLTGGVDISLDTFEMVGFSKTRALAKHDMHVYDSRGSGFIPGEGCGFVVLKRLEDARRDNNYVYAVINGWGISSDGKSTGLTAPSAYGQSLALKRVYENTPYGMDELNFIEGHGTGTTLGDKIELESISIAMGKSTTDLEKDRSCAMTSLKSLIGHCKAASGIGGFIKSVIAVNQRIIPPTAGCQYPHQIFGSEATQLYPALSGDILPCETTVRAGVSGMGFGGINCHVTIESGDTPHQELRTSLPEKNLLSSYQSTEVFLLAVNSKEVLKQSLKNLLVISKGISTAELPDLASKLSSELDNEALVRCSIIAGDPDELQDNIEEALIITQNKFPEKNIVVSNPTGKVSICNCVGNVVRIGLLFPGQGSQRLNMSKVLVERFQWAKDFTQQLDIAFEKHGEGTISKIMFRNTERAICQSVVDSWENELSMTEHTQPAVCLSSLLWFRYLKNMGLTPEAVCGHSLGELMAFYAADAISEEELFSLATLRGRAMSNTMCGPGKMLSLRCSKVEGEKVVNETDGYIILSSINGPNQVVLSGECAAIDMAAMIANKIGIKCKELPVSNAFHSDLASDAANIIKNESFLNKNINLKDKPILFSSCTGKEVQDGTSLNTYFSDQILSQVDFVSTIYNMSNFCDIFIEVGPGRVLSGLVNSILGKTVCYPIESSAFKDEDLNRVVSALFVNGASLHWSELYNGRFVKPFIPTSEKKFIESFCERDFNVTDVPSGVKTEQVLFPIIEGIPETLLSEYLKKRGSFLTKVIEADIECMAVNDKVVELETTKVNMHKIDKQSENVDENTTATKSVESVVFSCVSKITGFTQNSLNSEMRLLDDLNLDSIKAGDLIVNISKELSVTSPVDVLNFATASLRDVIKVFSDAAYPYKNTDEEPQRKSDLQENSIDLSNVQQYLEPWVRNFKIDIVEAPFKLELGEDVLKDANVLILYSKYSTSVSVALSKEITSKGAYVKTVTFEEALRDNNTIQDPIFSVRIVILPQVNQSLDGDADYLRKIVTQLSLTASVNYVSTLAYIQFTEKYFNNVDQYCASAFAKSVHLERKDLRVRVIDFPVTIDPFELSKQVVKEINTPEGFAVVGYDNNLTRYIERPVISEPAYYHDRGIKWSSDDVIFVTGGARGITASLALGVAKRTGVKMALVGSSPHPDENYGTESSKDITETLRRFSEHGQDAEYFSCDIKNKESVHRVVDEITKKMGPITGVIHGAGLNKPRPTHSVSVVDALDEVSPKVLGAVNLMSALEKFQLKLFVGVSSIIGFTGMPGNAWYGFSNEMLDNLLTKFRSNHPKTNTLSVCYSVWRDEGMGHRMGSVDYLKRIGIDAIPTEEGVDRFITLFMKDPGTDRIIVTARVAGLDTFSPELLPAPDNARFTEKVIYNNPGIESVFQTHLSLETDLYLKDHLFNGSYLLPTVFGLEAMAQAAAHAVGKKELKRVRIENVHLKRPITVDPETGADILIQAQVQEKSDKKDARKILTKIFKQDTGIHEAYFSAEFILGLEDTPKIVNFSKPEKPLLIIPEIDLYRENLLFQGPMFQRLEKLFSITQRGETGEEAEEVIFTTMVRNFEKNASMSFTKYEHKNMLLPDPFFRDSLLQSAQVCIPTLSCLPVFIEKLDIYPYENVSEGVLTGIIRFDWRREQKIQYSVQVVDNKGVVRETLSGYVLHIIKRFENNPFATDLINPEKRDNLYLQHSMSVMNDIFRVNSQALKIRYYEGIHKMSKDQRHKCEIPLMYDTLEMAFGPLPNLEIEWMDNGKPVVRCDNNKSACISVSHDDRLCMCVAGEGPQGCDVAPITPRSHNEWVGLIGKENEIILDTLLEASDTINHAGTRIWCVKEAGIKASGSRIIGMEILKIDKNAVLFNIRIPGGSLLVLTFPLILTWGPERMFSLIVSNASEDASLHEEAETDFANLVSINSYEIAEQGGPQGQSYFIRRFPVSFKHNAQLSRTVYFPNYFYWLGEVREIGTWPVLRKVAEQFGTGKWGLVSNKTNMKIFGEATACDIIEIRLWMNGTPRKRTPIMDMTFDYRKVLPDGKYERLAWCEHQATWVEILDHGVVKPSTYPEYFWKFMKNMLPHYDAPNTPDPMPEPLAFLTNPNGDVEQYQAPAKPVVEPLLFEKTIETSLDNSNLVGNIYFANYYAWQGQVRDHYLYRIIPEYFRGVGEKGEMLCLQTEVHHLREAMPFDVIFVTMALKSLTKYTVTFYFEYFKIERNGSKTKLAFGVQDNVWIMRDSSGNPVPTEFPKPVVDSFKKAIANILT